MTHVQEHFARDAREAREASDTNTGITRREGARVSERRICRVLDQPRSTQRYVHVQRDGDEHLIRRMHELVREHPRRGYRMMCGMLRLACPPNPDPPTMRVGASY